MRLWADFITLHMPLNHPLWRAQADPNLCFPSERAKQFAEDGERWLCLGAL
jgi:hypothetical protein